MQNFRPSETALKVALSMISLARAPGWADRLPPGTAELTEKLILSANAFGYNRATIRLSKRPMAVALYRRSERIMPGIFEGIGERKIFMNTEVERALADGYTQVLVFGAGFDTLCLRLAPHYPDVRFFEIDHPATAVAKRRGVEQIGQPDNLTLIAADLARQNVVDVLSASEDWDPGAPSVMVMEGLLYYLASDDVLELFARAHEVTGESARVAFSHRIDHRHESWAQPLLRMIGEPWLSSASVDELPDYIGAGWRIVSTQSPAIANAFEAFALAEKKTEKTEANPENDRDKDHD